MLREVIFLVLNKKFMFCGPDCGAVFTTQKKTGYGLTEVLSDYVWNRPRLIDCAL